MSRLYEDERATFAYNSYNDRRFTQDSSTTSFGSVLLAVLAAAYVVVKALEILGYPVWLWIHMANEKLYTLRLRGAGSTSGDTSPGEESQNAEMQRGGNVLSSVFGLNSSSLLQKGVRGVTGALSKGSSSVPPGLGNWDNSCYQNSVIQGLASLPSLRDYLSKTTGEYRTLDAETTNGALFDMISKLNDTENHGQHFWIHGKLKSMSTFQQQDAQEYYSKILDALDKEVQNASNSKRRTTASWLLAAKSLSDLPVATTGDEEKSTIEDEDAEPQKSPEQPKIVPNPLDGLLAQRVGCIKCGYSEGLQLIPFNCVTVSLGTNWAYDIRDCLDEYTNLEYIEGVECAKCTLLRLRDTLSPLAALKPECKARLEPVLEALEDDDFDDKTLVKKFNIPKKNWVKSTKSRQAVVARAPKALVLHVNRSIFDEMTGAQYKNNAGVAYPRVLDLGHWCLGSQPSDSHLPDSAEEEWPRDPTKSMVGGAQANPTSTPPFQYQLRAAVTHYGSHGNGHYVCYRPYPSKPEFSLNPDGALNSATNEQWWRFSDDTVYAVAEQEAHQGNVFMLFYERIDEHASSMQEEAETLQTIVPVEDLPLPPDCYIVSTGEALDDAAADVPLPTDDDDESLPDLVASPDAHAPPVALTGPSTPEERPTTPAAMKPISVESFAYPTPPPDTPSTTLQEDTEMSEADSEDAPSTQLTSDDEPDAAPNTPLPKVAPSPHFMRTAGQSPARGEGNRASLPMVTAT
ncbi:cysteine proteinase [Trematosphaeria pertusa]|uniref:ubiquitinyl hydrolase 1 n=1 Tax=Trematosphaeria pertusa TaxID=390896 RepID=A0A6A6INQ1_9PLEO|nr:cysteine proteinase [Trematosphaeria pertusa]KAF2252155.1 cysteine proteinase [Trematosphaeria pertusa]